MRIVPLALLLLSCSGISGCYYGHLASGQLRLLWNRQPIEEARLDPTNPEEVRALLGLVESVRDFAQELGLRVDGQYTSYVDWPGDRIVTTLVRTRIGELEVVPWWFPILGHLPYKGYFDADRAESEAERIRAQGEYELCVSGVTAYSTLGWFDDPVTRPMLSRGASSLVETLFHELVHATAFLPGEADFNEGVAQFIGQQAAIRFFASLETLHPKPSGRSEMSEPSDAEIEPGDPPAADAEFEPGARPAGTWPSSERVRAAIEDRAAIAMTTLAFRDRLVDLTGRPDRAERRLVAEREARAELAALPLSVYDASRVAEGARLSDACLALRGTYVRDLPKHAAVFAALDEDLPAMVARLALWSDESRPVADFFDVVHDSPDAHDLHDAATRIPRSHALATLPSPDRERPAESQRGR